MDQKGFWSLIDAVNKEVSPEDTDGILKATQEKLLQLPLREILDFHNLLTLYMDLADIPDLVAAATIINDGISDDGFTDFRAWLVSRGREVYLLMAGCCEYECGWAGWIYFQNKGRKFIA